MKRPTRHVQVFAHGPIARVACIACIAAVASLACSACATSVRLPRRAVDLNVEGASALVRGDLVAAEACLSVALEYSPRFVEAWVNLGYVELRRGNFEQAKRDFLKARDLNRDIPAPHHALGVWADKMGRRAEAERFYRAALAVDPGFVAARSNLARSLFSRGQYEDARMQFERLEHIAPASPIGWSGEAEALLRLGRDAEAEAVVAQARERFGDDPAVTLLVAREMLARGEWESAEAVLAPVAGSRERERASAALAWIAVARLGRGDREGAETAAHAALDRDGADPVARRVLGLVRLSQN